MEDRQEEMWRWQEEAFDREEKQLAMRKQHAEEIAELQMQQHQEQVQYAQEAHQFRLQQIDEQEQAFKDQWTIQEEQREKDLEYARKNLEISKAAAAEAAGYAERMAAAQKDMENIQRQQAVLVSAWQEAMTRALIEILKEIDPVEAGIVQGFLVQSTGQDQPMTTTMR
jgi:TolA-binding protein